MPSTIIWGSGSNHVKIPFDHVWLLRFERLYSETRCSHDSIYFILACRTLHDSITFIMETLKLYCTKYMLHFSKWVRQCKLCTLKIWGKMWQSLIKSLIKSSTVYMLLFYSFLTKSFTPFPILAPATPPHLCVVMVSHAVIWTDSVNGTSTFSLPILVFVYSLAAAHSTANYTRCSYMTDWCANYHATHGCSEHDYHWQYFCCGNQCGFSEGSV